MNIIKINGENYEEEVLHADQPILVDFYADWCGPCRMMSKIIDEIAEEATSIKIGKVNVDENQELANEYGVMSIPTMILFKDGEIEKVFVGVSDKKEILNAIEKIS